jgi:hypothetical protein
MRVLDCECGDTLQAANDEDLRKVLRRHYEQVHSGQGGVPTSDEEIAELLSQRAYEATDS